MKRANAYQQLEWIVKVHSSQLIPPYPVIIFCPNCGHGMIEANGTSFELSNDLGMSPSSLVGSDPWYRLRHSCKAKIVLYYK
jgi:hypothetical protein